MFRFTKQIDRAFFDGPPDICHQVRWEGYVIISIIIGED